MATQPQLQISRFATYDFVRVPNTAAPTIKAVASAVLAVKLLPVNSIKSEVEANGVM